jgi:hypothetical protein
MQKDRNAVERFKANWSPKKPLKVTVAKPDAHQESIIGTNLAE